MCSQNISHITSTLHGFKKYVCYLNFHILRSKTTVYDVIEHARKYCDGLPNDGDINAIFKDYKEKDKGLLGKYVEYALFSQKPNCDACSDFETIGIDLKVTAFKSLKSGNLNAKERLTITNIGNPSNENFGENIIAHDDVKDTKYYEKMRKALTIIVNNTDQKKYKTLEDVQKQRVLYMMNYDIEELPDVMQQVLYDDYAKISECIITGKITQKGQKYLHMHTHGSKGSKTRAFGFTSKFITRMIAYYIAKEKGVNIDDVLVITRNGHSISIRSSVFD